MADSERNCETNCACGTPARNTSAQPVKLNLGGSKKLQGDTNHLIVQTLIPAGLFEMGDTSGDENQGDGETPLHEVFVDQFEIDTTSVTNLQFKKFVESTGYVTEAEKFGNSAVFHLYVEADDKDVLGPAGGTPWWLWVTGADWAHPQGRNSTIDGIMDHPVVHVSWFDALAYCDWAGRRLPTEAEWERAARGGLSGKKYPWGDTEPEFLPNWPVNIWQGEFPVNNKAEDGFTTTAPVKTYAPNDFGLWQTVGNVWEWCADWFSPSTYRSSPRNNPGGPDNGLERVLRGGSYLCHNSYCNRYRNSARSRNAPNSSMGNAGFRTVGLVS